MNIQEKLIMAAEHLYGDIMTPEIREDFEMAIERHDERFMSIEAIQYSLKENTVTLNALEEASAILSCTYPKTSVRSGNKLFFNKFLELTKDLKEDEVTRPELKKQLLSLREKTKLLLVNIKEVEEGIEVLKEINSFKKYF